MFPALITACLMAQVPATSDSPPPPEQPVAIVPSEQPAQADNVEPQPAPEQPQEPQAQPAPRADEYEDVPPAFAAGPAAVGAGATALGFVAGGLCCGMGCMVPVALLIPYGFLVAPCLACPPWLGAGILSAGGSVLGGVWEFLAGNKRPLVWARLAAPPAVGMALMFPGVLLSFLAAAAGLVALVATGASTEGVVGAFGALWLASAVLTVGLLAGAAGALGTYAGLVVFDARNKE